MQTISGQTLYTISVTLQTHSVADVRVPVSSPSKSNAAVSVPTVSVHFGPHVTVHVVYLSDPDSLTEVKSVTDTHTLRNLLAVCVSSLVGTSRPLLLFLASFTAACGTRQSFHLPPSSLLHLPLSVSLQTIPPSISPFLPPCAQLSSVFQRGRTQHSSVCVCLCVGERYMSSLQRRG